MGAWDLMKSERYAEAVVAFSEEILTSPSQATYNNRGSAYLHLQEYDAALADFRSAEAVSGHVCAGEKVGVALWMADREPEAVATWAAGVEASIAGQVPYGDAAGGATPGNLLFFGGVRTGDEKAVALARRYLGRLVKTKRSASWPGPVSRYLLGRISEHDLVSTVSGVPILHEREMCQAHFYIGLCSLALGEDSAFREAMRRAHEFGRVSKLEHEYYLALHETAPEA
jgi:hypothetical protein